MKNYIPSENEIFMNDRQLAYFKEKILNIRKEILASLSYLDAHGVKPTPATGDIVDQANDAFDSATSARMCERDQAMLSELEKALARIANGTYGYCEVTGRPISLARLLARPTATLSIEAQESIERKKHASGMF